jgi:hypothetical protein
MEILDTHHIGNRSEAESWGTIDSAQREPVVIAGKSATSLSFCRHKNTIGCWRSTPRGLSGSAIRVVAQAAKAGLTETKLAEILTE